MKKYLIIVFLFLGGLNIYYVFSSSDKLGVETQQTLDIKTLKLKILDLVRHSDGIQVPDTLSMQDINGKTIKMSSLKGPKLIFRFTEFNCDLCVKAELPYLNKLAAKIGTDNIILLASYQNLRDLILFRKAHGIQLETYNVNMNSFKGHSIEKLNFPYLFVRDNNYKSMMVFLPEKSMPDLSEAYYTEVEKIFFKTFTSTATIKTDIIVDKKHYNFKSIQSGDKAEVNFKYTNTGDAPLIISSVQTSCGCTIPYYSKAPLQPGESSSIKVSYNTNIIGSFNKTISVYANTTNNPVILSISGNILD